MVPWPSALNSREERYHAGLRTAQDLLPSSRLKASHALVSRHDLAILVGLRRTLDGLASSWMIWTIVEE
jgi:hypothetical protein